MKNDVVPAAGGIVWSPKAGETRIAVIHRPRYGGDWALPKGKLDPNESWEEGAVREVKEEVGCDARLGEFAGEVRYPLPNAATKVVRFWHMFPRGEIGFAPSEEVDRLEWLTPQEAVQRLTYALERDLVARVAASGPP